MRRLIAVVATGLLMGGAVDSAAQAANPRFDRTPVVAVIDKSCPSGFTHGVIGGVQKCLHAGEYCAHGEARQYRRYGFVCTRVKGVYRLEHR